MIESLLDGDGDGSILDDVAGMVLNSGGNKKKGGLGGLLGGLFGGREIKLQITTELEAYGLFFC